MKGNGKETDGKEKGGKERGGERVGEGEDLPMYHVHEHHDPCIRTDERKKFDDKKKQKE